jgi:hypothetical protein
MAARRKKASRNPAARRAGVALTRVQQELPGDLRAFSRRARRGLAALERELARAQANPRREAARLLREASHALGRLEAEGERRWRQLATPARQRALRLLRRLESALATPVRRKAPARATRRQRRTR